MCCYTCHKGVSLGIQKGDSKSNNLKTKIMRDLILNFIRESGIVSFNDIIYALDLQTECQEAEMQIAFCKSRGS